MFIVADSRAVGGTSAIREHLRRLEPNIVVSDASTLTERLLQSVAEKRLYVTLASMLAALVLMLASLGMYGICSRSVVDRRKELAVRSALGANPRRFVRHAASNVIRVLLPACIGGTAVGWAVARGLARTVLGGSRAEWTTEINALICAAILLAGVGAVSVLIPARRVVRLKPSEILRSE